MVLPIVMVEVDQKGVLGMRLALPFLVLSWLCSVPALLYRARLGSRALAVRFAALKVGVTAKLGKEKVAANLTDVEAPDFYWKFRLDRLVAKKGKVLPYDEINYPNQCEEERYHSYMLDLTLRNLADDIDQQALATISDDDWMVIFKQICQWTSKVAGKGKRDESMLPENDIDLLKMYFPSMDTHDLEEPLAQELVGADFPYKTKKELYHAAVTDTLKLECDLDLGDKTTLDTTKVLQQLAEMKERRLASLDKVRDDLLAMVENPYPDDTARQHYQAMRSKLAALPQTPAAMEAQEAAETARIEEMANFAAQEDEPVDDHHHDHEGDHHTIAHAEPRLTIAEQFQRKYGLNLDELEARLVKFRADPDGYLSSTVLAAGGKKGLSVWQKMQEMVKGMSQTKQDEMKEIMKKVVDEA